MVSRDAGRPDPDVLLAQLKSEEEPLRGNLRILLGAASGAGKTYAMLQEGCRRKRRTTDVVIGFVEPRGRPQIEELMQELEVVPPRLISHNGTIVREMDTDAVIARHPKVALVDDLAHRNVPGAKHEKRYEDVQELLDAGITVITTLNVQNIESLSDYVKQAIGIDVQETVPDRVVEEAQQVELIDLPPEQLIERMREGRIYPPDQVEQALQTGFAVGNLMALRDLALRATARAVEEKLDAYAQARKLEGMTVGERIMVAVGYRPATREVIRRGWRLAAALKGDLVVVHVDPTQEKRKLRSAEDQRQLKASLEFAEDLGARVVRLDGRVSDQLIAYARTNHVSQLFLGHPARSRWDELLHGSITRDILRKEPDIHVHLIADRSSQSKKNGAMEESER